MPNESANDEGADPTKDIKAQNPGETTAADQVNANDPQKTEKLANTDDDLAEGSE